MNEYRNAKQVERQQDRQCESCQPQLARHPQREKMSTNYTRVTKKNKCPICHKADWCGISKDESIVVCMRVKSNKPSSNGGWIHKNKPTTNHSYTKKKTIEKYNPPDFDKYISEGTTRTTEAKIKQLAKTLEVSYASLIMLEAFHAKQDFTWGFPMKDYTERVIGIRYRSNRGKWSLKGGKAGLFISNKPSKDKTWLILEGPTDTAAALSLGFNAVGRPSCRGQEKMVRNFLDRRNPKQIIIIADNDEPKTNGQGSVFYPGIEGAQALGAVFGINYKIVMTPTKDFRQWVKEGVTRKQVISYIRSYK